MGQYWFPVNISKKEFVHPHKLASGLKLWEQLANHPGSGAALIVLCAAMPKPRGGGDFDLERNWHGPERTSEHHTTPGPMPDNYPEIAKRTIGRWAGDRIALIGDYAQDGDLPDATVPASTIYGLCSAGKWTDVSDDVCRVIEHELNGQFVGDSVREWIDPRARETAVDVNEKSTAEQPTATEDFECGVLEIDWDKRTFVVRGIGGHANDLMTPADALRTLRRRCPPERLRLAVVAWKENADGYQQLAFYDLPTFQHEVCNS